jgi:hypothetical protein
MSPRVVTTAPPEPTLADLDGIVQQLRTSWTSRITVRRQSTPQDIGLREIHVSLDGEWLGQLRPGQEVSREVPPGPHKLRVHNTLFWKTAEFTVKVGEQASFMATNREGFGTYSIMAFFMGGMPIYLSLERDYGRSNSEPHP